MAVTSRGHFLEIWLLMLFMHKGTDSGPASGFLPSYIPPSSPGTHVCLLGLPVQCEECERDTRTPSGHGTCGCATMEKLFNSLLSLPNLKVGFQLICNNQPLPQPSLSPPICKCSVMSWICNLLTHQETSEGEVWCHQPFSNYNSLQCLLHLCQRDIFPV